MCVHACEQKTSATNASLLFLLSWIVFVTVSKRRRTQWNGLSFVRASLLQADFDDLFDRVAVEGRSRSQSAPGGGVPEVSHTSPHVNASDHSRIQWHKTEIHKNHKFVDVVDAMQCD